MVSPWPRPQLHQPVGQVPPEARRVQRHDGADDGVAVGQPARILGLGRLVHQRIDHTAVHRNGFRRIGAQRAVEGLGAVGGEVVERLLERRRLVEVGLDRVGVGVDGAVENHRAHVLRELLGVGRADPGAVGVAEVGQLVVADRGPDRVEILGDVRGADVGQEVGAHLVDAALDERLRLVLDVRDTRGRVVHLGVGPQAVVVGVGVAPQCRGRRAHPARVEPDEVEPLTDRRRQRLDHADRRFDAGLARAARVDDQRTDLLAGRRKADHRQVGHIAVGLVVVDRHRDPAAYGVPRQLGLDAAGEPALLPLHRFADPRPGQHRATVDHPRAAGRTGHQRRHGNRDRGRAQDPAAAKQAHGNTWCHEPARPPGTAGPRPERVSVPPPAVPSSRPRNRRRGPTDRAAVPAWRSGPRRACRSATSR